MPSCRRLSRAGDSIALHLGRQKRHQDATKFPGLRPQPEVRRRGPSLVGRSRDTVGAGSLGRVFPSGPVRVRLQRRRGPEAQPLALRHGLEVSAVKLWAGGTRGRGGCRRGSPRTPVRGRLVSRTDPAGPEDERACSERPGSGAPRAPREGRGLPGGARNGAGGGGRGRMRPAPVPYWNESERGAPPPPPPPPERGWRGAGRAAGRPAPRSPAGRRARAGERGRRERKKLPRGGTKRRKERKKTSARREKRAIERARARKLPAGKKAGPPAGPSRAAA
ncbi:unnamed protein product [Rangifer tarandus platyrhynchus]|uniref:Uncharacterized protein n=2 Tax=Rangifer tarandus platyrhynchus TaxID=3082113 RepID=A0ABN8YDI7_RANTA|nr:unnamed protein product [Rangifer tarandus platyrhynchus]CAI9699960.1 unnamed protein product [Rangifer tarandus platyrhynchus]